MNATQTPTATALQIHSAEPCVAHALEGTTFVPVLRKNHRPTVQHISLQGTARMSVTKRNQPTIQKDVRQKIASYAAKGSCVMTISLTLVIQHPLLYAQNMTCACSHCSVF